MNNEQKPNKRDYLKFFVYKLSQRCLHAIGLIGTQDLKSRILTKREQYGLHNVIENTARFDFQKIGFKVKEYYAAIRPDMVRFVSGLPKRILEIGCGAGGFRTNFGDDVEYWGVEPCKDVAQIAGKLIDKVLLGTYDSVCPSIPEGYFDLVVCNDVIEHMQDPRKFLKDIRGKLAPGGKLIASIPNLRNAENIMELVVDGNFKYKNSGILDYTHFHLFTKRSFVEMATECGWEVEACQPINKMGFNRRDRRFASLAKHFIPEIKYLQIAVCLRPNEA